MTLDFNRQSTIDNRQSRLSVPLCLRGGIWFAGALLAVLSVASARADGGEAGLVIDFGNDVVRTFCVPFSGDGIAGDQLLAAAGLDTNVLGQAAGKVVCSINDTGCTHSGTFESCVCKCQGSNCRYWAFFTQKYGQSWVYSSLAVNRVTAKNGDMQAWKWGVGSPASAPVPASVTFEQVCGHGPQGSQPATPAPGQQTPTAVTSTSPVPGGPQGGGTSVSTSPTPLITVSGSPASAPETTVTLVPFSPTPTGAPAAPSAGDSDDDGGGSNSGLIAFGAIAALLLAAIGGAAIWRRTHGA